MKQTLPLIFCGVLFFISSCKTQEDIRRDKTVDNLHEQITQTQQNTANINVRFTSLEESVAKLNGQVEEINHAKEQKNPEETALKERIAGLEENLKKQNEAILAMSDKMIEQGKYLETVIKTLEEMAETKENNAKKKDDKDSRPVRADASIKTALAKYKAQKLEEAKEEFNSLIDNKKLAKKERELSTLYMGLIEFKLKNLEEAKVYFSKLFSDNPQSPHSPAALLNLARVFMQQKSKDEALQSIEELLTRFPKSKEVAEANKLKNKLKP